MYTAAGLKDIFEQTALCWMKEGNLNEAVRQSTAVLKADPWSFLAFVRTDGKLSQRKGRGWTGIRFPEPVL